MTFNAHKRQIKTVQEGLRWLEIVRDGSRGIERTRDGPRGIERGTEIGKCSQMRTSYVERFRPEKANLMLVMHNATDIYPTFPGDSTHIYPFLKGLVVSESSSGITAHVYIMFICPLMLQKAS